MSNKRESILQAVIDHIKNEGLITNLTIAEIAKKADVGKGTVYEYFQSKDEILAETLFYLLDISSLQLINQNNDSLDFKQSLYQHIESVLKMSQEYANLDTFFMTEDIGRVLKQEFKQKMKNRMMELKNKYEEYLTGIINKGVAEGLFRPIEDSYIIYIIGNTIVSSVTYYTHEEHDLKYNDFIDKVCNLIIKILL